MNKDRLIQLCCGTNILPYPWENFDTNVDVTKLPLPFPDGCAKMVFIEHALEHFTGPEAYYLLKDICRVLQPDGVVRICVPHLANITDRARREDLIVNHGHKLIMNIDVLCDLCTTAGFEGVFQTSRKEIDGHWKVKGNSKQWDDIETIRVEARKEMTI